MANATLSVVVPAFNESEYIETCIEALIAQGEYVDEIIVVDNNSSDNTSELIKKYQISCPKLRLLCESRPGVVHARNKGFDAASGELIGRIDADTIVGEGWAVAVHEFFERRDDFSGVTGLTYLYESPIAGLQRRWTNWRLVRGAQSAVRPVVAVPGSNMAMRRSAWLAVRDAVSDRTDIHEDIDYPSAWRVFVALWGRSRAWPQRFRVGVELVRRECMRDIIEHQRKLSSIMVCRIGS